MPNKFEAFRNSLADPKEFDELMGLVYDSAVASFNNSDFNGMLELADEVAEGIPGLERIPEDAFV